MPVQVRLPTLLRTATGGRSQVEVEGDTVGAALNSLQRAHPALVGQVVTEHGVLHRFVNVYVDDDDVRYLDGLDTRLLPESVISILPAVAGGA